MVGAIAPVLEIGGTHATAALVEIDTWTTLRAAHRRVVDSTGSADSIVESFVSAADAVAAPPGARWMVAMPDPFDYELGVGRFQNVDKFDALNGVDVRAQLLARISARPREVSFCNDADAFTLGEWLCGAAVGAHRVVGVTLGSGVGTGWIDAGRIVDPGTPAGGRARVLRCDGLPLEETMSRQAIKQAYRALAGDERVDVDVDDIALRARDGESTARTVLAHAVRTLGRALGGCLRAFAPELIVIGGSMAGSWDLFENWFVDGAGDGELPTISIALAREIPPLIGAAWNGTSDDCAVKTTFRA